MTRYKSIDPTGATRATVNRSECLQSRSAREIYDPFLATRVLREKLGEKGIWLVII